MFPIYTDINKKENHDIDYENEINKIEIYNEKLRVNISPNNTKDEKKYLNTQEQIDLKHRVIKRHNEHKVGSDKFKTDLFSTNNIATADEKKYLELHKAIDQVNSSQEGNVYEVGNQKLETDIFIQNKSETVYEENSLRVDEHINLENIDVSLFCPIIIMEIGDSPIRIKDELADDNTNTLGEQFNANLKNYINTIESFDLNTEENEMKKKLFGPLKPVQYTRIHCTACACHLGSALTGCENICVHPVLKVLICKRCYDFYSSGEFEKDDDGSEMFCRWCGQGGQVLCCAKCEMVFCVKCVRTNLGRIKLSEIMENDKWNCFRCDPSPLIHLKIHCAEFLEYLRKEIISATKFQNSCSFLSKDYTQCCNSEKSNIDEAKKRKRHIKVDPDYNPYYYEKTLRSSLVNEKIGCSSPSENQNMSQVSSILSTLAYAPKRVASSAQNSTSCIVTNSTCKSPKIGKFDSQSGNSNPITPNEKTPPVCTVLIKKEPWMENATLSASKSPYIQTQNAQKLSVLLKTTKVQEGNVAIPILKKNPAHFIEKPLNQLGNNQTPKATILAPRPYHLYNTQKLSNQLPTTQIQRILPATSIFQNLQTHNKKSFNQLGINQLRKITVLPRPRNYRIVHNQQPLNKPDKYDIVRKKDCCQKTIQLAAHSSYSLSSTLVKLKDKRANASNLVDMVTIHNELQTVLNSTLVEFSNLKANLGIAFKSGATRAVPAITTSSPQQPLTSVHLMKNENVANSNTTQNKNCLVQTMMNVNLKSAELIKGNVTDQFRVNPDK